MNILLSGGLDFSEHIAKQNGWKLFGRTNASFLSDKNEQVLNVINEIDLVGLKVDTVYIHQSFFINPRFFAILKQTQLRSSDFVYLEKIDLSKEFQVIKKPIYLTKWQKFKAFLGGKFKIQWNGENI